MDGALDLGSGLPRRRRSNLGGCPFPGLAASALGCFRHHALASGLTLNRLNFSTPRHADAASCSPPMLQRSASPLPCCSVRSFHRPGLLGKLDSTSNITLVATLVITLSAPATPFLLPASPRWLGRSTHDATVPGAASRECPSAPRRFPRPCRDRGEAAPASASRSRDRADERLP